MTKPVGADFIPRFVLRLQTNPNPQQSQCKVKQRSNKRDDDDKCRRYLDITYPEYAVMERVHHIQDRVHQ